MKPNEKRKNRNSLFIALPKQKNFSLITFFLIEERRKNFQW